MDFVEQVKSSIDIVNVVGEYVRLRKQGASSKYLGLCPFHSEKTPSFNVDASKQFYYCFGCQKGGDAFKFVMEIEAVTFFEALKSLADRYGIAMPKRAEYSDAETKLKERSLRDARNGRAPVREQPEQSRRRRSAGLSRQARTVERDCRGVRTRLIRPRRAGAGAAVSSNTAFRARRSKRRA